MGLPERYLEPPAGWDGPPLGYARNDDDSLDDFFAELESEDVLSNPLPPDETRSPDPVAEEPNPDGDLPPDPEFVATIEEVEDYTCTASRSCPCSTISASMPRSSHRPKN